MVKYFRNFLGESSNSMPAKGKRSLPVDEATHREIAIESATIGRDMYLIVADAWAAYKLAKQATADAEKSSTDATKALARGLRVHEKLTDSKKPQPKAG